MRKHRFDVASFIFGAIFLAMPIVYSIDTIDLQWDLMRWVFAAVLLVGGLLTILTSRDRARDDRPPRS